MEPLSAPEDIPVGRVAVVSDKGTFRTDHDDNVTGVG
jgi:hypothetical protein